jgi:benzoate membrane transport protein
MSEEVDQDATQRYRAAVWAGVFYLMTGLFGATVVMLFLIFPTELVMAIAGIALLNTIAQSLNSALSNENAREPALITFLVTVSGFTLLGVGSAFWGLVAGMCAFHWFQYQRSRLLR